MARYDNEEPRILPEPQVPEPDRESGGSRREPLHSGGFGGGAVAARREHFPKYQFEGGVKPPPQYRHDNYGHEKEGAKVRKKLGKDFGIGAIPRSPLPDGIQSLTIFQPEILMKTSAWENPSPGVRRIQDTLSEMTISWWEDKNQNVTIAANLSFDDACRLCLEEGVPSFVAIIFPEERDSFRTVYMVSERGGMKKKREHRVTGITPSEVLEKAESTLGFKVPLPPSTPTES